VPTTVAPTTTQTETTVNVAVDAPQTSTTQERVVPTTVHDHSTHSHGPLPQTGANAKALYLLALMLFASGVLLLGINKERR
jgi:LPXTG-motif cell wall-anchored protein